jgi:hypothetical protein
MGHDLHDLCGGVDCRRDYILHGTFQKLMSPCRMLTMGQLFVAWMAGARFDIAYYQFKEQMGGLLGWTTSNATKIAEVTKVVEAAPGHSEL